MSDLNCPYCDKELEINQDDGFGYEENVSHQMKCEHCGKLFVFTTSISFYYEGYKADCLNEDGKHDWQPTKTYPKQFIRMRCTICDNERKPTDDEMKIILSIN